MDLKKYLLLSLSFLISALILIISFGNLQIPSPLHDVLGAVITNKLTFGKDIVLPGGPLNYFLVKPSVYFPPYLIFLFDLFILTNLTYIFYRIGLRSRLSITLRVILLALIIAMSVPGFNLSLFLLWMFLFLLLDCLEEINYAALASATLIAAIIFYTEIGVGLFAFFYLLVTLVYLLTRKTLRWSVGLLYLIGYAAIIFVFSIGLHTRIGSYIANGLAMANGIGDGLHAEIVETHGLIELAAAVACLAVVIVSAWLQLRSRVSDPNGPFLYFVVFLYLFVLFRLGFTNIENNHFFDLAVPGVALLVLFAKDGQEATFRHAFLPVLLLALVVTGRAPRLIDRIRDSWKIERMWVRYELEKPAMREYGETKSLYIPERSVDVIQSDLSVVSDGSFHYTPRPVPLSHFVNANRLDELNAAFIAERGPQLILLSNLSVGNHYPLFDEPLTKIELLKNYRGKKLMANGSGVLLERRNEPVTYSFDSRSEERYEWNDTIQTEISDEIQLIYPSIEYSLIGKIFRFLFWAPELNITFTLMDNSTRTFKFSKSLDSGLIINKLVIPGDNHDFLLFVEHRGKLSRSIKSFQFTSSSEWAYKKEFVLKSGLIKFDEEDSSLETYYKPLEVDKGHESDENIRANIEEFTVDKSRVDLFGWSFIDDTAYTKLQVTPLFASESHTLIFPHIKNFPRPDVVQAFGNNVPYMCGFGGVVFKQFLKEEIYRMGIGFMDRNRVVKRLIFDNYVVDNRPAAIRENGKESFTGITLFENDREDTLLNNIDVLRVTEHAITIKGWAAMPGKSSRQHDPTSVILRSDGGKIFAVKLKPVRRLDVSDYFKNSMMDSTGFDYIVSTDSLESGQYDLGLYIELRRPKRGMYQFLRSVVVGYPKQFQVKLFTERTQVGAMKFGINKFEDHKSEFTIAGWAFDEHVRDGSSISILLKAKDNSIYISRTKLVKRPDVTLHFNSKENLDESGFEAEISKTGLLLGEYEIGILLRSKDGRVNTVQFTEEFIRK